MRDPDYWRRYEQSEKRKAWVARYKAEGKRQAALDRYAGSEKQKASIAKASAKRSAARAADRVENPKPPPMGYAEVKRRYAVSEKQAATRARAWRRRYKVTPEDTQRLRDQTACAICGRSDVGLVLDHRHEPHQVRDHLCRRCNILVGMVEGPLLQKAIKYVEHWNAKPL